MRMKEILYMYTCTLHSSEWKFEYNYSLLVNTITLTN